MKKRYMLALIMIGVTLTACGGEKTTIEPPQAEVIVTPSPAEEPSKEAVATEEPVKTEEPSATEEPVQTEIPSVYGGTDISAYLNARVLNSTEEQKEIPVGIFTAYSHKNISKSYKVEDETFASTSYDVLYMADSANENKLADAVNKYFSEVAVKDDAFLETMFADMAVMKSNPDYDTDMSEYYDGTVYVTRNDEAVFSFRNNYESYAGGAHGNYGIEAVIFDAKTGEELKWQDIYTCDADEFEQMIIDELEKDYAEDLEYFDDYKTFIHRAVNRQTITSAYGDYSYSYTYDLVCYLSDKGLEVVFNPYDIAAYAYGMQAVTLSYEKYGEYMYDRFVQ